MRISDWSSDVCSSDLRLDETAVDGKIAGIEPLSPKSTPKSDRRGLRLAISMPLTVLQSCSIIHRRTSVLVASSPNSLFRSAYARRRYCFDCPYPYWPRLSRSVQCHALPQDRKSTRLNSSQ